ncbi:hypothetical protein JCM6882_006201 [Rhodosporidiobolus microsporus]
MTSLDGIELSEYYVKRSTGAQDKAYRAARRPALADPLEKGVTLTWSGPNLYPETTPPSDYPYNATPEPTPNPPRPLLPALLAVDSPSQGGSGWSLKLVEPLMVGEDRYSQVWRCEVVPPPRVPGPVGTVILKLRHQALFPLPEDFDSCPEVDSWNWLPAKHLARRERLAFDRLRPYQGRDVPLCYGFYLFDLPSAETVIGVVLEDLKAEETISLADFLNREHAGGRLSFENVLPISNRREPPSNFNAACKTAKPCRCARPFGTCSQPASLCETERQP